MSSVSSASARRALRRALRRAVRQSWDGPSHSLPAILCLALILIGCGQEIAPSSAPLNESTEHASVDDPRSDAKTIYVRASGMVKKLGIT